MTEVPSSFSRDLTKKLHSLRPFWQFRVFLLYVLLGGGLIILAALNAPSQSKLRSLLLEANLYLEKVSLGPEALFASFLHSTQALWHHHDKILSLEETVQAQETWQLKARALEHENNDLRALLNLPARQSSPQFVTAQLYTRAKNPSENTYFVTMQGHQGPADTVVRQYSPVVKGDHLIGYIYETGLHTALVRPVTSPQSRIPIISERSGLKAVLAGTGKGLLKILHVDQSLPFEEGELVFSSSEGSLYPANYIVGQITYHKDGHAQVMPLATFKKSSYVFILPPLLREDL